MQQIVDVISLKKELLAAAMAFTTKYATYRA
jgi:hypothetical protein